MGLAKNTFLRFWRENTFCGFGGKYVFDEKVCFAGLMEKVFFLRFLAGNAFLRFWREMCIFFVFVGKVHFFAVLAGKQDFRFGGKARFSVLAGELNFLVLAGKQDFFCFSRRKTIFCFGEKTCFMVLAGKHVFAVLA